MHVPHRRWRKRSVQAEMVNTIVFHAEADAAAAAQIATMLSARRKPLTYCVTQDNAAATAQLRMGAHMIALGLISPHTDANAARRVLAPVLNGRRRALLLMPGANPPDDILAAAPSVALHGDHAADFALVDNIERYASAIPQRARATAARTPVLEFATGAPHWTPSPMLDAPPPRRSAAADDGEAETADPPRRLPVTTILLCAAAAASLGFFAWRTYEMQRVDEPRRPAFAAPLEATSTDQVATDNLAETPPTTTAPPANTEPTDAAPLVEELPAPIDEAPELRGREAQGPDR